MRRASPSRLDVGGAQLHRVVVGPAESDRSFREHAMPDGRRAGWHAQQFHRHDLPAEERDDAPHGANEDPLAGTPAHGLRKRQSADRLRHHLRQDVLRGAAGHRAAGGDGCAPRRLDDDELRDVHLLLAGEARGRARGLALGVVGGRCRRAQDLEKLVLLALGHAAGHDGQPTRRGISLGRRRSQALVGQGGLELADEVHPRAALRRGRNLLRPDLEKKVEPVHTAVAGSGSGAGRPDASRRAAYARAHAQASSRTRRMRPTRSVAETAPRASRMLNWCEQTRAAS